MRAALEKQHRPQLRRPLVWKGQPEAGWGLPSSEAAKGLAREGCHLRGASTIPISQDRDQSPAHSRRLLSAGRMGAQGAPATLSV